MIAGSRGFEMLIDGLARAIQADRQREIEERMRQRGLLRDAADATETLDRRVARTIVPRSAGARSQSTPAHGRMR
jgi:hypothetical protein